MLLGRGDELERLGERLRGGRSIAVAGEAGVGKTALLRAASAAAERRVFEGGALSTLSWMPYLALERALGRRLPEADTAWIAGEVEQAVGDGVLIIDDVQWADGATRDVIALLAQRISLLVGVRTGDPGTDAALASLDTAGVELLDLAPLDETASGALAHALRPDLSDVAVARVLRRTGGNPLLIEELIATEEPTDSLRLAIAARLRHLGLGARNAMALLSLAARPLAEETLGEGAGALEANGIAIRGVDGLALRHALLGEVLIDDLTDDETLALRTKLATALEAEAPGEAARHYAAIGDKDRAYALARAAASDADTPSERVEHLLVAAAAATSADGDALRLRVVRTFFSLGRHFDGEALLDLIHTDDPELQATAHQCRSVLAWGRGEPESARAEAEAGLALLEDVPGTEIEISLRLNLLQVVLFVDADLDRAEKLADEAVTLSTLYGYQDDLPQMFVGTILVIRKNYDEALRVLHEAIEKARAYERWSVEFDCARSLYVAYLDLGRHDEARAFLEEMIGRARELRFAAREVWFRKELINLDALAGRFVEALAETRATLDEPITFRMLQDFQIQLVEILIPLGSFDEAFATIEAALPTSAADASGRGTFLYYRAEAELWSGRAADAIATIDDLLTDPASIMVWAAAGKWVQAWAAFDLGGEHEAPDEAELTLAYDYERFALAAMNTDPAEAAHRFEDAEAQWHAHSVVGFVRCAWATGEAWRRAGRVEDARAKLLAAEEKAREFGLLPLLSRIERSLRLLGETRQSKRAAHAKGITTRQAEILALVGNGLSNEEIGRRLGVSANTVKRQISLASSKLGAANRVQAAILASDA